MSPPLPRQGVPNYGPNFKSVAPVAVRNQCGPVLFWMSTSGQVVTPMITKMYTAVCQTSPDALWKFEEDWADSLGGVAWQRFAR